MSAKDAGGYLNPTESWLAAQVEIRAPRSRVFDFFTDYRNVKGLIRYITRIRPLDLENTRCVGAQFLAHVNYHYVGLDLLLEVVDLEDQVHYELELVRPRLDVACAIDFQAVPGGTLVELVATYTLPQLPSLVRRLVPEREIRSGVAKLLNNVKAILDEPDSA